MNELIEQTDAETGDAKCNFEVSIKFTRNSTWQGSIVWAKRNLKQDFRSALEMLKLMDEAMLESVESEESTKWENID